jgi:MFS family permease
MAGLKLIPLMIGIVSLSIISGKQISKHGHYKRFPIMGALVMTSGLLLLSTLKRDTSYAILSLFAILVGAGLGLSMQTIVIALQNDVEFKDMGVATSANTFFRTLGGAFGTALFGTIFANRVSSYLQENFAKLAQTQPQVMAGITPEQIELVTTNTSVINQFPPSVQQSVLDSFVSAFHVVFISAAPFTLAGFVLALFLVEKPLRTSQEHHAARTEASGESIG